MTPLRMMQILYPADHVYKVALYPSVVTHEAYTPEGEWVGAGYEAGGVTLTGHRVEMDGEEAVLRFNNAEWLNADIQTRTIMVYDATTNDVIHLTHLERTAGVCGGWVEYRVPDEGVERLG